MDYEELRAVRNRKVNTTVYLSLTLLEVIDRICEVEGVAQSRVVERVIRKGLLVERDERAKAVA